VALVSRFAKDMGFTVIGRSGSQEMIAELPSLNADAAIVDLRMPEISGLEVLKAIHDADPACQVILMTAHASVDSAIEAVKLVAGALHKLGGRRDRKYIACNCSAIVETLFESELFGHMRGAFTGATEAKPGLFELADGGTLFMDEIGELPLTMQAKLLRVVEYGEVQRVGSTSPRRVDVHVIAATNRNLPQEVAAGRFRQDRYP